MMLRAIKRQPAVGPPSTPGPSSTDTIVNPAKFAQQSSQLEDDTLLRKQRINSNSESLGSDETTTDRSEAVRTYNQEKMADDESRRSRLSSHRSVGLEEIGAAKVIQDDVDEELTPRRHNSNGYIEDFDPVLRDIPWHVRRVVSLTDDPNLPTITFRFFFLVFLFIAPGAFLSQMSKFRTTYAPYSIFFVQIAAHYVGGWMADWMPAWNIRVPGTRYGFNLNPGPFSVKEHVLVTIAASSGATYNLGYVPVAMAELYFGIRINPGVAIFFMLAIVWIGYSYAALARQFLIYDPKYPWFQALCQTALFETQSKQREAPSPTSRRQMLVFFLTLGGITLWQFLPEFVFPMLGSLAVLCWIAPNSATANFLGAGFGGMGFLNLSLDWSNVGYLGSMGSLFLTPWWTQVIVFVAFVINCWFLLPLARWGGLGGWDLHLMSNRIYTQNGTLYPILDLMTSDVTFNETAYAENGPVYIGTQLLWADFFDYGSFTSALSWMLLFGWPHIRDGYRKLRARWEHGSTQTVNHQYGDQLNILMRAYDEVPTWWFIALFSVAFTILVCTVATGHLFIPIWTLFIALATGAIVVIPLGWLYSLSNYQLETGSTNEVIYGLMVNAGSGHRNPCGASVYGSIAGNAWYRAQYMLQDQKLGHYMHIPPRAVFLAQILGSLIGVPINYGVVRWVLNTKSEYISGREVDPTHQWTGQSLATSLTMGVQYVLIGPQRLFAQSLFRPLPYGFLAGALAPAAIYLLHKSFPRARFTLFNTTIFFAAMSNFYGNISTGYLSGIIGGYVVMYWAYRRHYELWARYNYILAGAFDMGFNLNMLLIFLFFGAWKMVLMPHWWGNDARSSERCFALDS